MAGAGKVGRIPLIKIIYVCSLAILGALVVFVLFGPFNSGRDYTAIQKEQLLKTDQGWIIQFDLVNPEKKDWLYRIKVAVDGGRTYEEKVLVRSGGIFTYVHHLQSEKVGNGKVKVAIFRGMEKDPFEEANYYLK